MRQREGEGEWRGRGLKHFGAQVFLSDTQESVAILNLRCKKETQSQQMFTIVYVIFNFVKNNFQVVQRDIS